MYILKVIGLLDPSVVLDQKTILDPHMSKECLQCVWSKIARSIFFTVARHIRVQKSMYLKYFYCEVFVTLSQTNSFIFS